MTTSICDDIAYSMIESETDFPRHVDFFYENFAPDHPELCKMEDARNESVTELLTEILRQKLSLVATDKITGDIVGQFLCEVHVATEEAKNVNSDQENLAIFKDQTWANFFTLGGRLQSC